MMRTCCFTGHRHIAGKAYPALSVSLFSVLRPLIENGFTDFLCGGALGFDTLAAETVLSLREEYPHIRLCMILPCRDQDKNWTETQKKRYLEILHKADETVYLYENYVPGCMHLRNRYLVDHAELCIAYYNGLAGGTAYTVNYAYKNGVRVQILGN